MSYSDDSRDHAVVVRRWKTGGVSVFDQNFPDNVVHLSGDFPHAEFFRIMWENRILYRPPFGLTERALQIVKTTNFKARVHVVDNPKDLTDIEAHTVGVYVPPSAAAAFEKGIKEANLPVI